MADSQVKTANICNITSSTTLSPNVGGSGTYISDNNISVYMSGTVAWSGIYCQYTNVDAVVNDYYTISFTPICATNSTLQIEVAGTAKKITFTSGTRTSVTIQASSTSRYVAFYGGDTVEKTVIIRDIQIEKGETATPYRPYSATGWLHSLRKLATATEAVENPLYSDGTAITAYTLKGNTVQNGTPTPSNPVEVNGVGVRTENLIDESKVTPNTYIGGSGETGSSTASNLTDYIDINASPFVISGVITGSIQSTNNRAVCFYDSDKNFISSVSYSPNVMTSPALISDIPQNAKYVRFAFDKAFENGIMLNAGQTALPYEPYGYKIPILTNQTTTNIYIGDNPLRKSLDGTAYDTLDSNGTLTQRVDSDGSVLATPIVSQITVPSIPTVDGANTITIDTTVQPSEFTATWTGWHDSSVKEYDGSQWQ